MNARPSILLAAALLAVAPGAGAAQQTVASEEAFARFVETVEVARAELIAVRRDIHRNPEISGQEVRTAGIIAERLRAAGFDVSTGIGGHGVVGVLRGAAEGPMLAFRADMDAVRSTAPDPVAFASEIPGVRHICGHDIHTTIGLALAEGFAAVRGQMAGSVMLIFQPAEESATGARAMLDDGVFLDLTPDAVFALHTSPMPVGQVAIARETQMPGRDAVRVDVGGTGDLESAARSARELLMSIATVTGQDAFTPTADDFILAQGVRASEDTNGGWRAIATLTTSSRETSRAAQRQIENGLRDLAREGIEFTLDYQERWIAGVTNTPALVDAANVSARAVLGENAVIPIESMAPAFSEDFGSFQDEVPGAMYFLGVSNAERGWVGMPHTPDYVADEEAIFVGARTMAAVFLDFFAIGLPGR